MTTLVAIAEPSRDRRSEPTPSAMVLSGLLHVVAVLALVAVTYLVPRAVPIEIPQERTVEVVMVPPQPQPQVEPGAPIPTSRPNLSRDAAIGEESMAPQPSERPAIDV